MANFKMQPMGFTFVFVAFMSIQPMVVFVVCMGANPMNVHKPIQSRFLLKNEIKSQSIKTLLPPNCTIFECTNGDIWILGLCKIPPSLPPPPPSPPSPSPSPPPPPPPSPPPSPPSPPPPPSFTSTPFSTTTSPSLTTSFTPTNN
ncbi:unnamed protein product [Sphagnum balticum]